MSDKLQLQILTPEKESVNQSVDAVYLQGVDGQLGILPNHTALVAQLKFGVTVFHADGKEHHMLCGKGVVEVNDNQVNVLVRSSEREEEINVERAKRALERAKSRRDSKDQDIDMLRAEAQLQRAIHRLRFIGHQI